jgi:uncharacterized protein
MKWTPGGRSSNLEDRRGSRIGGRTMGVGGSLIVLVLSLIFGTNLFDAVPGGSVVAPPASADAPVTASPEEERMVQFVSMVLDSTQTTWARLLPSLGRQYEDARLVLFRDAVQSGCGTAPAAAGPFYCPLDQKVYVDLSFFDQLDSRFGAPGDFAQAYVLAHEIGHHVQHLLGIEQQVRQGSQQRPAQANQLSVLLELQADCFAGVWGNAAQRKGMLDPGDVEEGLGAAAAVGDDAIQRASTGSVHQESFTHGSSAQRAEWFRRGFQSGDPNSCDTFAGVS